MDTYSLPAEPADSAAIWSVPPDVRCSPRHGDVFVVLVLLVPMTLTATLGTISFSSPDGTAIGSFWPAAAFQVVFSIWFGVCGALAGVVGPMLGNALAGASPFMFIPANILQSTIPGLAFRRLNLDPRLRSRRDWVGMVLVGCLLGNALGASAGVAESYLRETIGASHCLSKWLTWLGGNVLPCLVLVPALLLSCSSMMVRTRHFFQRFCGRADCGHLGLTHWFRLNDMPMLFKLMLLATATGIGPLCVLAGVRVWETIDRANRSTRQAVLDGVRAIRDECDRHELLMRNWAVQLDDPGLTDDDRQGLVGKWQARTDAFRDLTIADAEATYAALLPRAPKAAVDQRPVQFFGAHHHGQPEVVRAVAPLKGLPGQCLTAVCVWREQGGYSEVLRGDGLIVLDGRGRELYRETCPDLDDWSPRGLSDLDDPATIEHAGRSWYVATAEIKRLDTRIVWLVGKHTGRIAMLGQIPRTSAVATNVAIFGAIIISGMMARRMGSRVTDMAEQVHTNGATPGALKLPEDGSDELAYLARSLNHMSSDLADYVRELRATTAEKERLAHELELARRLQESVLPKRPIEVPNYDLAALSEPALEVGGDFYDYFEVPGGPFAVMIGDASGKGLHAALFMAEARGIVRAAALDGLMPGRCLQAANRAMALQRPNADAFITLFCALLDTEADRLHYANGGHNSPMLVRRGEVVPLQATGLPIGVVEEADYELHQEGVLPGDTIVMYSDGITEALNEGQKLFTADRLQGVLARHASATAAEMLQAVMAEVRDFSGEAPPSDDRTVVVLRRCC